MPSRVSKPSPISIRFTPEHRRLFEVIAKAESRERGVTVAPSTIIRELAVRAAKATIEHQRLAA